MTEKWGDGFYHCGNLSEGEWDMRRLRHNVISGHIKTLCGKSVSQISWDFPHDFIDAAHPPVSGCPKCLVCAAHEDLALLLLANF